MPRWETHGQSQIIGKYHISSPQIVGIQDGENHFQPGLMICVFFFHPLIDRLQN